MPTPIKDKINQTKSDAIATNPYAPVNAQFSRVKAATDALSLVNNGGLDATAVDAEWASQHGQIASAVSTHSSGAATHWADYWKAEYENYKTIPGMLKAATSIRKTIAYQDATNFGDESEWDLDSSAYLGLDYERNGTLAFAPDIIEGITSDVDALLAQLALDVPSGTLTATTASDVSDVLNPISSYLNSLVSLQSSRRNTEGTTYSAAKSYVQAYGYVSQVENNTSADSAAITAALAGNYPDPPVI